MRIAACFTANNYTLFLYRKIDATENYFYPVLASAENTCTDRQNTAHFAFFKVVYNKCLFALVQTSFLLYNKLIKTLFWRILL